MGNKSFFSKMKQKKETSNQRLEAIRSKVGSVIEKNREEVGSGKSISEIELDLFSNILDIGRLLLADRIVGEEEQLENTDYSIEGKKNKEPRK